MTYFSLAFDLLEDGDDPATESHAIRNPFAKQGEEGADDTWQQAVEEEEEVWEHERVSIGRDESEDEQARE